MRQDRGRVLIALPFSSKSLYLVSSLTGLILNVTVISRWFGKFKKLTTGKRNLHFIEIKGFGKNLQILKDRKFVRLQDVFYQGARSNPGDSLPTSGILNQPIFLRKLPQKYNWMRSP